MPSGRSREHGRRGRALAGWVAVAAVVGACVVWQPRAAPAETADEAKADLALGGELYAFWCVHCHGSRGQGVPGEGVRAGPPINDTDVAYHDLVLRTGRMPIVEPRVGIVSDPGFGDAERVSLVTWMAESFDLPGSVPQVGRGDPASGAELYATHCAACHGGGGVGGVAGGGNPVREVKGLDPEAIVAAMRVGPFSMPRFSDDLLSDDDAADVAAFVSAMSEDSRTPLGFRELNRVSVGALVAPLMVAVAAAVFIAAHAGTKRGQ